MPPNGEDSKESDALLGGSSNGGSSYTVSLDALGSNNAAPRSAASSSLPAVQQNQADIFSRMGGPVKAYSISAPGVVSYLTPVEMGRQELYEVLPYYSVFGLQTKERNLSKAFATFASESQLLDTESQATDEQKALLRNKSKMLVLEELAVDKDVVTMPLIFAVLVASMAQFLVGYNTGVMNAPESVVFPGHTLTMWSLSVAAMPVGGPIGAVAAGKLADSRGRRRALLICICIFLLGGAVQTFAPNMTSIIVGRFLLGFASGYSSVIVPIYLGELAPPTLRGTLGTLTQFALVIGILVSNLFGFIFATERLWRVLFGITIIVAVGQLICAPYLLESPRWILGRDPASKEARAIIKKIRGFRYDHEVETEANHYITASRAQNCSSGNCDRVATKASLSQMLFDGRVRKLLLSCLFLQVAQQLCGINAVFYYSTMFFDGIISNPLVGTTIVGAVNVVATYIALLLMDSWGRRTLLLWSSGGMFLCCLFIVIALLGFLPNMVALAAVNLYVSFFEIGLGPIPWLIVAEMFDAKYVTTAMSACSQLNFTCNFIIGLVFPYMNEYMGAYSFAPFAFVLLVTFVFTLVYLPETQGTTPEQLQADMKQRKSMVMKFSEEGSSNPLDDEWTKALEQLKAEHGGEKK